MAPGFQRLVRAAWRERGFGDFWGYTLVADGVAVWAWNTNDARAIAVARAMSVDGLMTDDLRLFG